MRKAEGGLVGGGARPQDEIFILQNCFPDTCAQFFFPISPLSHLRGLAQIYRNWNETSSQTRKLELKISRGGLDSQGCVTWDREATSYLDQFIYKSNQRESMSGASFQSGSQLILQPSAVKGTDTPKHTKQQHRNSLKIRRSLIWTEYEKETKKYIERHDKTVTTILIQTKTKSQKLKNTKS